VFGANHGTGAELADNVACQACARSNIACVRRKDLVFKMSRYVDGQGRPSTARNSTRSSPLGELSEQAQDSISHARSGDTPITIATESMQVEAPAASASDHGLPMHSEVQDYALATPQTSLTEVESFIPRSRSANEPIEISRSHSIDQEHAGLASLSERQQSPESSLNRDAALYNPLSIPVISPPTASIPSPRAELDSTWPLADMREASLLHYFCIHLAPWVSALTIL
jgi:hypothetical protein